MPTASYAILVIEDVSDHRELTTFALQARDLQVTSAANGAEAMQLLKTLVPSLIVTDLSMPKMDGWEVLKEVRANPATRHIPVIAMSAYVGNTDHDVALEAGFDAVLLKPVPTRTLYRTIMECIQRAGQEDSPQATSTADTGEPNSSGVGA